MMVCPKKMLAAFSLLVLCALSAHSLGRKDEGEMCRGEEENTLRYINIQSTAAFGEGGGNVEEAIGADRRINPGLYESNEGEASGVVAASCVTLTGFVQVKGRGSTRKFFLLCTDGKKYALQVNARDYEPFARMNETFISVNGVFYDDYFLVFDYSIKE